MATAADIQAELDRRTAKMQALKDEITRREATEPEDTVIPGLHFARAFQTVKDLGNVGAQGLSLGFSDEIKAGLSSAFSDQTYEQAKQDEQAKIHDAKVRMNAVTPGSGQVFEGLTTMATPLGIAGATGKVPSLLKPLVPVAAGATAGGVSAYGHDAPVGPGIAVGAAGGLLSPLGAAAGRYAPYWGAGVGAGVGGTAGSAVLPGIGSYIGMGAGTVAGKSIGEGVKGAVLSPTGRDLLARMAALPGRFYGGAAGQ
jgi:hypothetical protein